MTENEAQELHQNILAGAQEAIDKALDRHRKLGESIAVWQDGRVVILEADEIPISPKNSESH